LVFFLFLFCFLFIVFVCLFQSPTSLVRVWHANTYRLENTLNYGLERGWAIATLPSTKLVALGFDQGAMVIRLGSDAPAASMDGAGKIVLARHQDIQTANLRTLPATELAAAGDGDRLPVQLKDLGATEIFPQTLAHSANGRFVAACGDGEYVIYTALAWRNKAFGQGAEFVWGNGAAEYAVREGGARIVIYRNFAERACGGGGLLCFDCSVFFFFLVVF
jgi:coatomer subunit beta'